MNTIQIFSHKDKLNKTKKAICFDSSLYVFCEAQARVRQGSARDGSQDERP